MTLSERTNPPLILLATIVFVLLPVSAKANWSYSSSGNVLSAYGEGGYTAESPLSITLSAPADLQFNGNYKPATISNTSAWTAAGLTVPTILYNGKTNAPSLLGTYTASISAGGATAEVTYTIKTVISYLSFFDGELTQGKNFDVISGTGAYEVALNNSENKGVYWDAEENCAVFDGEAYLQIDNPLGHVTAATGFTLTMDVYISSDNNGSGQFYRSTGAYVNKSGWQRLFDLSDGHEEDCIFINAGNASNGTAHLMWCLRKGYGSGQLEVWNNTKRSFFDDWSTITLVVAPGGYTTLYVNGEVLTHSSSSDIPKITNVLNYISGYDKCFIGTSIFEAGGGNADGFFFGKIRGFQTAEGALMPYFDGSNYHYLLSYATNGGNPITGTFEATIPTTLPTPTHPNASAEFQGWYTDEELTIPVTTGVTLTRNTALYAKWSFPVTAASVLGESKYVTTFYHGTVDYQLPAGALAYTAEKVDGKVVFYRIGSDSNVIPKNTAVIIVADSSDPITLTKLASTTVTAKTGNILQGSDVEIAKPSGAVYVLGVVDSTLGFYPFTGDVIPAGKAYYVVN